MGLDSRVSVITEWHLICRTHHLGEQAAGIDSFRVTSLRASGAHSRKFAEHGLAPSAGVEPDVGSIPCIHAIRVRLTE
jgi:hypothetical protein